jgi:threonine-phosphate decarboxylase
MNVFHGGNVYAAAERLGVDWREILDFSASINPLGPSPRALQAIQQAFDRIAHYPEPSAKRLRIALSDAWGNDPDRLLAGNGATELLFLWCRLHGPGTIAAPAFSEFHRLWPAAPVVSLEDPSRWPSQGSLVLTRPANPTGYLPDGDRIVEFADSRSDPVLVDESFIDFTDQPSLVTKARGNLFVVRSLTKFWALPGLRLGVLVGDVTAVRAHLPPWTVNAFAEAAALASLADTGHAIRSREFVRTESRWLAGELSRFGFAVIEPVANYLYARTPFARHLTRDAAARGLLIRDCTDWPGLPEPAIRVAVRTRSENEALISVLEDLLCVRS